MKRTTLVLEDAHMERVREIARREGRTMSELVNEILLEGLDRRRRREHKEFELRSFSMGKPSVNLADRDAVENLIE
jgi:predicted DNA-binding ribbon-helix-helix protein